MLDYAIQTTLDYANWDTNRIIEVFRITGVR